MKINKLFQHLRILPLLVIVPALYLIWDKFGAEALQQSVKPPLSVQATPLGSAAPDFKVPPSQTWSKQEFQLHSLKGYPVVLHFWATWCAPCLQELPELLLAAERLRPLGFSFIAVAIDDSWGTLDLFFRQHPELEAMRNKMILILDPQAKIADKYSSKRFPETFLINVGMVMDNKFTGAQPWSAPEMGKYFTNLSNKGDQK